MARAYAASVVGVILDPLLLGFDDPLRNMKNRMLFIFASLLAVFAVVGVHFLDSPGSVPTS